jgi:hypothetical protein
MGAKSAQNLVDNIAASKTRGLARVLNALSIRHVGVRGAAALAGHFGSIDAMLAATVDELAAVEEIGPIIAASIHDFLHNEAGQRAIEQLRAAGLDMTAPKRERPPEGPLTGKTVVVTGTLEKYTRASIFSVTFSRVAETPYLIAFSTSGCRIRAGRRADSSSSGMSICTFSLLGKRTFSMSRYRRWRSISSAKVTSADGSSDRLVRKKVDRASNISSAFSARPVMTSDDRELSVLKRKCGLTW